MAADPNAELSRKDKIIASGCLVAIVIGILLIVIWLVSVCGNGDVAPIPTARPTERPTPSQTLIKTVMEIEEVQWDIERLSNQIADKTQLSDEWCRIFLRIDDKVKEYDRLNAQLDRIGGRNPDIAFERELEDLKNQFDFDIFARSCRF